MNGQILAQGSQFSVKDVEVVCATVDLEDVRSYRSCTPSRGMQAAVAPAYVRVFADITLSRKWSEGGCVATEPITVRYHTPEEEIQYVSPNFILYIDLID